MKTLLRYLLLDYQQENEPLYKYKRIIYHLLHTDLSDMMFSLNDIENVYKALNALNMFDKVTLHWARTSDFIIQHNLDHQKKCIRLLSAHQL